MKIIGITGGIGAGKTQVLEYLNSRYGATVCQADEVAKKLQKKGGACYDAIVEHFGQEILDEKGELDRARLGDIVFADRSQLSVLNRIVHPAVKDEILKKIRQEERKNTNLFVIEAALLIEDHYEELCEEFWYIHTEPEIRKERLRASRGYTDEKIEAIFRNQQTDEGFRAHCREAIDNSGSPGETLAQVRALLVKKGLWSERYEGKGDT